MATADISRDSVNANAAQNAPVLQSKLGALARRRNAQQMTRALVRAAIPGVAVAAVSVALYKFHIIPDGPVWAPAAMIGVSLLWGARNGWLARRGNFVAARDADDALKFDDRLSSALSFVAPNEVQQTQRVKADNSRLGRVKSVLLPQTHTTSGHAMPTTNLVPALVGDAATRAASLDPRRVYPFRFDRRTQILTALSLAFVGSLFLPDNPILMTAQQKKERAAIMKEGEKLVAVSKEIRKDEKPKEEEVKALNAKLDKLGKKMARGRMTKRAALTDIGELKKKLEDSSKPGNKGKSGSMPQIPEAIKQTPLQSEVGRKVQQDLQDNKSDEAAKELDKLADRLDKGQVGKQEKKDIANDLDKVAKDLESRGGQANKDAAQQLKEAAKQLRQEQQGQKPGEQNSAQDGQKQSPQGQQKDDQQSEQGQNGQQKQDGKQGQQQQSGQQGAQQKDGKQGQSQQGQQGAQQNGKKGQGKQGQQGSQGQSQQGQGKQGQQGSSGQSQQGQQGQQGQSGASGAMRDMANGLRQGKGGGSGDMRQMLDKLRQAENGANGNGNMNGTPGNAGGRTFGSKSEMGNMVTPGKDLKATDPYGFSGGGAGLGPRNHSQGVNSGGGVSKKKSTRTGDKRRYEDAWTDQLTATQKKLSKIKGKWGGSGEVEQLPTKGEGKGGQSSTPLYDVGQSYKKDAEDAVSRDSVPPAYKQPVKDYFDTFKE